MKKYSYEEFLEIIETLRSENGCPWDREQTHMSLRPCLVEEAAEVLAGIRIFDQTSHYENLREELGDLLLQVVMHAQIAKEEGVFTMEDVVDEVAEKMIRRHPHVFGDVSVDGSAQVLRNWDEIKKKEKEGKEIFENPLREIPLELPSLARATKVLKKKDKLYGENRSYEESVEALEQLVEDMKQYSAGNAEGREAVNTDRISERIGDILLEIANISRIHKISPEIILDDRIENMIAEYDN